MIIPFGIFDAYAELLCYTVIMERLKELRLEKNLSQLELAKAIGFSQSSIVYWETGQRVPNAQAVIILARFFGVSTDYLLGEKDY